MDIIPWVLGYAPEVSRRSGEKAALRRLPKRRQPGPRPGHDELATPARTIPRLQSRIACLYRIMLAVKLTKIGKPEHRQPVHVLFAGFEQGVQIGRDLGPRLGAGRGGAVHQE